MNLDFVTEVWGVLISHVDLNERNDAAESLVNFLIDNNYEPDAIKDSFRSEKEILKALKDYISEQEEDEEEDYDEEDLDEWD